MKSIVLLSGGLDSLVSLANAKNESEVLLALTFDYGHRSAKGESAAAEKIAKHYGIPHKILHLDWLSQITKTSLVNRDKPVPVVTERDLHCKLEITQDNARAVWVPNRNAVFINIAAAYAESLGADTIVAGFNSEEAATFPDNSIQFISAVNQSLRLSTLSKPRVISYVQSYNKGGIVNLGVKLGVPFDLIYSCYREGHGKMCGQCESCSRVMRAFKQTSNWDLIKDKFPKEDEK